MNVCVSGVRNVSFSESFAYVLHGWYLNKNVEAYLGLYQTFMVGVSPKIVNGFKLLTIFVKRPNVDVWKEPLE